MTIVVAGGTGLAGSAIVRAYQATGAEVVVINRKVVDLLDRDVTTAFLKSVKPSLVVDAAAKVGGIGANNAYPVEFLSDNVRIQSNLMEAAHAADVEKFIFLIINMLTSKSNKLSSMQDGNVEKIIPASDLSSSTNNTSNFTYSVWFYIEDWTYRYGQEKVILTRIDSDRNPSPQIALGAFQNNLNVFTVSIIVSLL